MAMGWREGERQMPLWIAGTDLPSGPEHPFYKRLNTILAKYGFDRFVEGLCAPYYAEKMGRHQPGTSLRSRSLVLTDLRKGHYTCPAGIPARAPRTCSEPKRRCFRWTASALLKLW